MSAVRLVTTCIAVPPLYPHSFTFLIAIHFAGYQYRVIDDQTKMISVLLGWQSSGSHSMSPFDSMVWYNHNTLTIICQYLILTIMQINICICM